MVTEIAIDFDVQNFYSLISEKAEDFVGRQWIFGEIDDWLNDNSQSKPKYFIVTGKAGSGKSTIAAELIKISNGISDNGDNKNNEVKICSDFKNIKNDFLDAYYIISFKDNLSTDLKPFQNLLHIN